MNKVIGPQFLCKSAWFSLAHHHPLPHLVVTRDARSQKHQKLAKSNAPA
jgi:hypothetical protein